MITVRIRFEKTGEAAYISLLDLQRVFHRILKRSGLPVYYTQGFNPHIYLSFACPLSLGQESLCECCEVKTEAEDPQLDTWCDVLQPYMPRGIKVLSAQQAQKMAEGEMQGTSLTGAEKKLLVQILQLAANKNSEMQPAVDELKKLWKESS